ncbi:hypothetical protein vseg_012041 [Gypsophila vaccaria]
MDNNTSNVNLCPDENCSGNVCEKTPYKTKNYNLEIYDTKGTECDDINDAVELSVAASEALVIHGIIQSDSIPEALSATAILEVVLRVKQARLDELQESVYCRFKDSDYTSDTLSDLSDSDLEDVYKDVGLSIGNLDDISSVDPSVSRVKDTPMTDVLTEEDTEAQNEWSQNQGTSLKNRFLARPSEDADKTEELSNGSFVEKREKLSRNANIDSVPPTPRHQGNGTLDNNIQMIQGYNNGRVDVDHSAQRKIKSSLQLLHSGEANFKRESGGSSCGYQSRWFGGWGAKEGDVCGGKETNAVKTICKMLINEASYLSESTYVPSDQNSVVNCPQSCSNSSKANKSLEDSYKTSTREVVLSQDLVNDCDSSFIDPLCSVVPCSISSEIGKSLIPTKNCDDPRVNKSVPSLKIGTKAPLETVRTRSDQNGEIIGRKEHTELVLSDECINPIIKRQTKSLKEYSRGLQEISPPSLEKRINIRLEEEESILGCASAKINEEHEDMRSLAVDQHVSCSNTSNENVPDKQPLFRSNTSYTIPTNGEESHLGYSARRYFEEQCERSDKNVTQTQIDMLDMPESPLVLRHRTRRFRAPRLPVIYLSRGIHVDEQVCGSKNICHKNKEVPEDQLHGLANTENSARKRVRFSDADIEPRSKKSLKRNPTCRISGRVINKLKPIDEEQGITGQEVKERLTNCRLNGRKRSIFRGMDFLLTGFSKKKEQEIEGLLRKHGGVVLSDIPTPIPRLRERSSSRSCAERLPVVICPRKLQTTQFLYGCAVNAFLLRAGWAYDSVKAGSVLPPNKYEVLLHRTHKRLNQIGKSFRRNDVDYIFVKVGIMLHGTHGFCTNLAKVIKHGRGLVYKSLHWLVQSLDKKKISLGAIIVEDDNQATRHLKKYALEQKIPVMPASWIVNSLLEGKLLPVQDNIHWRQSPAAEDPLVSVLQDWSQEI